MPADRTAHGIAQRLLAELSGQAAGTRYPPEARLGPDLGVDSLRMLFLLTRVEEETGAAVGGEGGGGAVRTAGDVEALVARCLTAAAPRGAPAEPSVEDRLAALVHEVAGDGLPVGVGADTPLASLGMDSQTLVALYARIERTFGVEFDLDTPSSCFVSIAGMAEHLRSVRPAAPRSPRGAP